MSRILLIANHDVYIYNFRLEIINRCLSEGNEVIISSPYGERVEDLKKIGCEFFDIQFSRHGMNPFKELKLIHEYKKLIKKVKPDIVLSYTIKPNIYGGMACKKYNIPYVANITGLGTAVENGGIVQKITTFLYKIALKNAQRIFFQNTENMQFFINHKIALGRHELLPGSGVNLDKFVPLEYPSDKKIEFAFISRIMKEKGIDQYIEAAEYIKTKYPNVIFHVCGFCEQDYEKKLKELHEKNVVVFHGMVRDVREIFKKVHCTVHPTYYPEGISNILLESSACARPIITTDRSGCREVIDDGITGFIVKQKDSQDLIAKIEKFIDLTYEERKNMGLAARRKVEKEFDRQIVVEKYIREVNILANKIEE